MDNLNVMDIMDGPGHHSTTYHQTTTPETLLLSDLPPGGGLRGSLPDTVGVLDAAADQVGDLHDGLGHLLDHEPVQLAVRVVAGVPLEDDRQLHLALERLHRHRAQGEPPLRLLDDGAVGQHAVPLAQLEGEAVLGPVPLDFKLDLQLKFVVGASSHATSWASSSHHGHHAGIMDVT